MAYCTLDDVKTYLGITETTDDALIETCITAAKAAIDNYCSTAFDVDTDTTRCYNNQSHLIEGRGLHLDRYTLATAPTMVKLNGVDVTSSVKTYEVPIYRLVLSGASGLSWRDCSSDYDPEDAIEITGKWGYSVTPPQPIVQACIIWASHLYQIKDAAPDGTLSLSTVEQQQRVVAIPHNAQALLEPYRRHW